MAKLDKHARHQPLSKVHRYPSSQSPDISLSILETAYLLGFTGTCTTLRFTEINQKKSKCLVLWEIICGLIPKDQTNLI